MKHQFEKKIKVDVQKHSSTSPIGKKPKPTAALNKLMRQINKWKKVYKKQSQNLKLYEICLLLNHIKIWLKFD